MLAIRLMILICLLIATPLLFLGVAWLPAQVVALTQYQQWRNAAGTPSFHEGAEREFRLTLAAILIDAAAILCVSMSAIVLLRPASRFAIFAWIAIAATSTAHLYRFSAAHPLQGVSGVPPSTIVLFWGIPAAIAVLAIAGAATSSVLVIRRH